MQLLRQSSFGTFYKQYMPSSEEKYKKSLLFVIFFMAFIATISSQSQQCSQSVPRNTSSFPFCSYFYNNCTSKSKSFAFCSYCGDNKIAISKEKCTKLVNSTQVSDCNARCVEKETVTEESSSRVWLQVLIPILIGLGAIVVICCICRKFMRDAPVEYSLPEAVIIQGEGVRLGEVASERRFSSAEDQPVQLQHQPIPYRHWEVIERSQCYPQDEDQCIICLEIAVTCRLACSHKYHTECIRQWFNVHEYCPTCKLEQIRNVNIFCRICRLKQYSIPLWLFKRGGIENICEGCMPRSSSNEIEG